MLYFYIMPKRRRAEAARKGWKKQNSNESEACGINQKKCKLWDDSSMTKAMEAVKNGKMGVHRAAEEYNMPRTTLKDILDGRVKHGSKSGPDPYLTSSEEDELVSFLINACKMGQGKK